MANFVIQIRFTKKGRARFLSHRELMTVLERAVRRANIPVKMSEGFNPRPRLSFPTALPLGIESVDELMFLTLAEWLSVSEIAKRLQEQLKNGVTGSGGNGTEIGILSAEPVLSKELPRVKGIEYQIYFLSPEKTPAEETIKHLLAQPNIIVQRLRDDQYKQVDIKRFITTLRRVDSQTVSLVVQYTPDGSVSPGEIIKALGVPGGLAEPGVQVRKTKTLI